jgi:signal peptidase I
MTEPTDSLPATDPPKGIVRDYFETIVTCVIFVLFARTYVFQQSKIPTGSMIPTLLIGDYIMVNKHVFAPTSFDWERKLLPIRDVRRHDIIVFKYPEEPEKDYIKRIIGLPGDVVEVRHRRLYVNGQLQNEPFIQHIYPEGANLDQGAAGPLFRHGRQPGQQPRQPGLGIRAAGLHQRQGVRGLLVL